MPDPRVITYPGPPTRHTYGVGDTAIDPNGVIWYCTVAGDAKSGGTAVFTSNTAAFVPFSGVLAAATSAAGGLTGDTGAGQWNLSSRQGIGLPVPTFRPATANTTLAADLMPNGTPSDGGNGLTWFDACDSDVISGSSGSVGTARVAVHAGTAEFGSYSFGGAAAKNLAFTVNNGEQNMMLFASGQLALYAGTGYGATTSQNSGYILTVTNTSGGTAGYVAVNVQSGTGLGQLLCFSSGFNYDSNNFQNATQVAATGGPLLLATAGAFDLIFIAGGDTVSSNTVARFDHNQNIFLGHPAALATTATNGFVSIPSSAGTPTGVPTLKTGLVPIEIDTTNGRLWAYYGSAWHFVALT